MRIRRIIEWPCQVAAVAFIAIILSGVVCGCAAHKAQLQAFDFNDQVMVELGKGTDEYQVALDAQYLKARNITIREGLRNAAANPGNLEIVAVGTSEVPGLIPRLDKIDAARENSRDRHGRMHGNLRALFQINSKSRALAEVRLGIGDDLRKYLGSLRERALAAQADQGELK